MKNIITSLIAILLPLCLSATRIVVLSDIHVTPGNANEQKLIEAVNEINSMNEVDLVVMNGDLTNEGSDEQLKNAKSILDKISFPLYTLPGNHENNWSQSATKTFFDLWGNDRFVTEVDSLIIIGCNCGPYMKMGDGHVKQEDLHWLKSTLDRLVTEGKRVVSFNHYPLRKNDLDNYADYIKILEQYPTIIHINGHYHKYERYRAGGIDAMMVAALDQTKGRYGYSIIDIDDSTVKIYRKLLGNAPDLLETVEIQTSIAPFVETDESTENQKLTTENRKPKTENHKIEKIWTDSASIFTRLAFNYSNIFFGNSLGQVKSVDKKNGKLNWVTETGASLFSRPAVHDNNLFVPTTTNQLLLLDLNSGAVKESFESTGPYVADGLIESDGYYQGGYKKIEKRDKNNGILIWQFDSIDNYCQAAPTVHCNEIIFGAWDTYLRCLDKNTGTLKWKWNNGKNANMLGPGNVVPVVTDSKVIIVAPDRFMTAIDRNTGRTIWRDNSHRYRESLGTSVDGTRVYAKTMDGELVAVDANADSFTELWTVDMGIGYDHAPCIVAETTDGIIYAGSRRGIISAVDHSGKLLWNETVGASEINGIDIDPSDNSVYVSLIEGTVFRIAK